MELQVPSTQSEKPNIGLDTDVFPSYMKMGKGGVTAMEAETEETGCRFRVSAAQIQGRGRSQEDKASVVIDGAMTVKGVHLTMSDKELIKGTVTSSSSSSSSCSSSSSPSSSSSSSSSSFAFPSSLSSPLSSPSFHTQDLFPGSSKDKLDKSYNFLNLEDLKRPEEAVPQHAKEIAECEEQLKNLELGEEDLRGESIMMVTTLLDGHGPGDGNHVARSLNENFGSLVMQEFAKLQQRIGEKCKKLKEVKVKELEKIETSKAPKTETETETETETDSLTEAQDVKKSESGISQEKNQKGNPLLETLLCYLVARVDLHYKALQQADEKAHSEKSTTGACIVCLVLTTTATGEKRCYAVNTGDARGWMLRPVSETSSWRWRSLTVDHNLSNPAEVTRIATTFDAGVEKSDRRYGDLGPTRALGNWKLGCRFAENERIKRLAKFKKEIEAPLNEQLEQVAGTPSEGTIRAELELLRKKLKEENELKDRTCTYSAFPHSVSCIVPSGSILVLASDGLYETQFTTEEGFPVSDEESVAKHLEQNKSIMQCILYCLEKVKDPLEATASAISGLLNRYIPTASRVDNATLVVCQVE